MKSASRFRRARAVPRGIGRRAFLAGTGGVAIGLPFLESLPQRSAWAVGDEPRFALFIATMCGVETSRFWPSEDGPLTNLAADTHAASVLADFADVLLFPRGVGYPGGFGGCPHADALSMMFTGAPPQGSGAEAVSTAASIDTILAPHLNPEGVEPMALYAGLKAGYINERISFTEPGVVRAAQGSPYDAYQDLLRAFMPDPSSVDEAVLDELTARRACAVDLVRDELATLLGRSGLGADDRQRLELHMDALRDIEKTLDAMQEESDTLRCTRDIVDEAALEAVRETYRKNGTNDTIARLHLDILTFAFACNLNHLATLQTGDGSDGTIYDVPSNDRGWRLHYICNRTQSDGGSGNDALAVEAHAEIDVLRLQTLRYGLERFAERDLLDKSIVMWANELSECPSHWTGDLPIILAGNPGGALNTGRQVWVGEELRPLPNAAILTTVAHALGVSEPIGLEGHAVVLEELLA